MTICLRVLGGGNSFIYPIFFISSLVVYLNSQLAMSTDDFIQEKRHRFSKLFFKRFSFWPLLHVQLVIFKPLSYWFEETIGFDVKPSFSSCPVSRLIRWYNKRILRKGSSVPRDFSWIENYKLYLWHSSYLFTYSPTWFKKSFAHFRYVELRLFPNVMPSLWIYSYLLYPHKCDW